MNIVAYRYFTVLAHAYGFSMKNMRRGGSTLPNKGGQLSTVINTLGISWKIEAPSRIIDKSAQELLRDSVNINEYKIQLMHQFVAARSELDNVSRFMFLYNLALQMNSDKQAQLDNAILQIEPSCNVSKSPTRERDETIYTRLRNQIAHCRDNTNFETTRKEIDGIVNDFQEMVLKMLPALNDNFAHENTKS